MRSGRARSGSYRALSGAVVALCVLSQVATAAHLVMVRHSFCALHGEAVDVDSSSAPHHRAAVAHDESISGEPHDDATLDAHNHCALAGDRADRIALPPASAVRVPLALPAEHARTPDSAARIASARLLLLLAPKTSPPA